MTLAGQISSLGYSTCTHWEEVTEIDIDKLTVLAGLAVREDDVLINPYLERRFAVAVVTTDYELNLLGFYSPQPAAKMDE